MSQENYWKQKHLMVLHDPPHKPYGIANHEATIKSNLNIFGLSEEEFKSETFRKYKADSFAAAADRFIFPNPRRKWKSEQLSSNWLENGLPFIHPFCGTTLKPHEYPITKNVAEDWMSIALKTAIQEQSPSKENFIKAWRLWEKNLVEHGNGSKGYFPFLVADTRIPDHTIWQHNALVSALASCKNEPAFFIFQIGPVQSFIAQAKTTRDLWAGSYILSYLNAKAMHYIADTLGPDHIIFPQVKGNPMIDMEFWDIYGEDLEFSEEALDKWKQKQLLIPSLPNRFLAIIPKDVQDSIEANLNRVVCNTWNNIAESVKKYLKNIITNDENLSSYKDWDCLWEEQVKSFPKIDSIIVPFENNEIIIDEFKNGSPPSENPSEHSALQHLKWATDDIYNAEKNNSYYDNRNYKSKYNLFDRTSTLLDKDNNILDNKCMPIIDNLGATWALQYMKTEWLFGGLKAGRTFSQRFDFNKQELQTAKRDALQATKRNVEKDHLDGTNEIIGGANAKKFWNALSQCNDLKESFRSNQRYGAISIIKRLFDKAYLNDIYDLGGKFRYPIKSTYEIASGKPEIMDSDELQSDDCKYYAVICFDGDNMGKWLSGELSQPVIEQLSGKGIKEFFRDNSHNMHMQRNVSPAYHAAFSEALANFANYCVNPIVSAFGGQLIYAGGDDVLAMVPAINAIQCSEALQIAFRGLKPQNSDSLVYKKLTNIFNYEWSETTKEQYVDGFLKLKNPGSARPKSIMLLPGPRITASVGIAIGHVKTPMQDIIQAAREAEQTAKQNQKDGFCLTIKKRSGETNGFFTHWNHAGENDKWQVTTQNSDSLKEYSNLYYVWNEMQNNPVFADSSNRLPYIYIQNLAPLLKQRNGQYEKEFDATLAEAALEFLVVVLERQTGLKNKDARGKAEYLINKINLNNITPENYINFWMCYAFMNRIEKGEE